MYWKNVTQITKVVKVSYIYSLSGTNSKEFCTYFFNQGEELEKMQGLPTSVKL